LIIDCTKSAFETLKISNYSVKKKVLKPANIWTGKNNAKIASK